MGKKGKIYVILIALIALLIIVLEYNKPIKLNWFASYAKHHKIPYGTYVFFQELERIFTEDKIVDVDRPPFEYLGDNDINGTYYFNNSDVIFDDAELDKLLNWTANGNTLVIASETINNKILDTLNLERSFVSNFNNFNNVFDLKLSNKTLDNNTTYTYEKANFVYHFNKIDTLQTKVIGTVANASDKDSKDNAKSKEQYINVIKQGFGDGEIILNLFPQSHTNYFILEAKNKNYTAGLLSYLNPEHTIYFDNYYKNGKIIAMSPMHVFLKAKQLKWAYYIMLIGVLFYIFFEGKRKQRAIKIVKPLPNKTLDFTRTIANMYYESGKHSDIAQHKILHFLEHIRTQWHLNTNTINSNFLKNLAARSNNTLEDTKSIFKTIETVSKTNTISAEVLEQLNSKIETYKSKNTWKTKI